MKDCECPYCGEDQEINHDDGYGYEENGVYEIPLQSGLPVLLPSIAPRGTNQPIIRKENGQFEFIQDCSDTSGKPCVYTVLGNIFGKDIQTYSSVAELVYGGELTIYGRKIADANLASDCSGDPIMLVPGIRIVIPK